MSEPDSRGAAIDRETAGRLAGRRVLVTGAFGFLGGHVSRVLVDSGCTVCGVDIDTSEGRASQLGLTGLRQEIQVETGDVTDAGFLDELFARSNFDHVFNFAASASVIQRAIVDPIRSIESSSMGVLHLLEGLRRSGQEVASVVHVSSDKVYGDSKGLPYSELGTALRGRGIYEVSKIAADLFARAHSDAFGTRVAVARLCNIFGPFDLDAMPYRLVPKSMAAMFGATATAPNVYRRSRNHRRDYLFVDDCCRALILLALRAAESSEFAGRAFNLPGAANLTTAQMCSKAIEAAALVAERNGREDRAAAIRRNGYQIAEEPGQVVEIAVQEASGELLRDTTGFHPERSIELGLAATAQFYWDYYERTMS
ncbi:MAG: NAD(P)-dependent oxidoreductase [Planctomycetota bacterium]